MVSTPIGAARDITLRALDILSLADIIAAEDTRNTRKLMDIHGITLGDRKLISYHDHNGAEKRPFLLKALEEGRSVALVSDAGTPLLADPGYHLAQHVRDEGHNVRTAPGASALLAALCVAGQPTDKFFFAGFAPNKTKARTDYFRSLAAIPSTLVFYESPKRLSKCLADMVTAFGGARSTTICRELTKKFEEARSGTLQELVDHYADVPTPKGEIVIVVGTPVKVEMTQDDIDAALLTALKDMKVKDAANKVSLEMGISRKEAYNRALDIKDNG
ncbi:16S rRNA (cytidine(1402)-2'-O)-methyltransferase [Amylibacter sp. SFDW26]|nr:16S rRNA (cytidine(1402)-2'-O)-methyltransferase [Amylibacter sp. SFDW26]